MIPITPEEISKLDLDSYCYKLPEHLLDTLIGESIKEICGNPDWNRETNHCDLCNNTNWKDSGYFKTLEGDPTKAGFITLDAGTNVERKIYKTLHTPTGSIIQYRKIIHPQYGECWEVNDG